MWAKTGVWRDQIIPHGVAKIEHHKPHFTPATATLDDEKINQTKKYSLTTGQRGLEKRRGQLSVEWIYTTSGAGDGEKTVFHAMQPGRRHFQLRIDKHG